jgi:hypothetical protein
MKIHDRWIHICNIPVVVLDGSPDDSHAKPGADVLVASRITACLDKSISCGIQSDPGNIRSPCNERSILGGYGTCGSLALGLCDTADANLPGPVTYK